jgi:hypothetical protein
VLGFQQYFWPVAMSASTAIHLARAYVSSPGRSFTRFVKSLGCEACHFFRASMGVWWLRAR